jgi:hypothetical protein
MRKFLLIVSIIAFTLSSNSQSTVENVIIITTDGLRWQEVFKGMDTAIAINKRFNQRDSLYLFNSYWNDDLQKRKKLLMPFMWGKIAEQGSVYGNRDLGVKVNVSNPYRFSYPGYNEIFTGYADTLIDSNDFPSNPNITLLEFLNEQKKFKGKIAAFGAWEAFDRILNEQRSSIPVISAFDTVKQPNANQKMINAMLKDSHKPWRSHECLDVFTHYAALENLKTVKPKILYIAYGETDEWAHAGEYRNYLDATRQFDKWLSDIWNYVQSQPLYRNKTALFITCDHGRGDKKKDEWTSHGASIVGADEIWFAVLSPTIQPKGEVKETLQVYQNQFAQTIASFLGVEYTATHPIGTKITF